MADENEKVTQNNEEVNDNKVEEDKQTEEVNENENDNEDEQNENEKENDNDNESDDDEKGGKGILDLLNIIRQFSLCDPKKEAKKEPIFELTLERVAQQIKDGKAKNIIVMTGAGISVAAGIPDFRSPKTGLYHQLQKYDLPTPESVFEINFFKANPKPFCTLSKELYPDNYTPTKAHYFIRLLNEKGVLLRNFTQNIDTLERAAGVPGDKLVEAHGSFASAHCIGCRKEYSSQFVREKIFADEIPRCDECKELVKSDIVFFGESLPPRFFELMKTDFPKCDLLIIIGTSLMVHPFAGLISAVNDDCPRLLINRERVGVSYGSGLRLGSESNYRDIEKLGDIETIIPQFVELLGWEQEFNAILSSTSHNNNNNNNDNESKS